MKGSKGKPSTTGLSLDFETLLAKFPHVAPDIIHWVIENVPNPREVERSLERLEKAALTNIKGNT